MLREGNATHDQVCLDQLPTYLTPSTLSVRFINEKNKSEPRVIKENLVTSASGDLLSVTTAENPTITPTVNASTSAKGEMTTGGNTEPAFTLPSTFYLEYFGKHHFYVGTSCKSPLTCEMMSMVPCSNTWIYSGLPLCLFSLSVLQV